MVLKSFTYYRRNKKIKISVEVCDTIWKKFKGLMFRKNSPPLLFPFKKEKTISIHSFFCKSFKAIWIDNKKRITKELEISFPKANFTGFGKYLLEIPLSRPNSSKKSQKKKIKQ